MLFAGNKLSTGAIVGISVGAVALVLLVGFLVALFILHKKRNQPMSPRSKRRAQMRKFCSDVGVL
jgi:hypothetical protein